MRNFRLVKTETIQKMLDCFTEDEEYKEFGVGLNQLGQELQYLGIKALRDNEKLAMVLAKQTFTFAMFCRDNMDVIQQLVATVDYRTISEDMVKTLTEEGELEKEWD